MGIFDIFKKKQVHKELKSLEFDELGKWLQEENNKITEKERELENKINLKLKVLIDNLNSGISKLEDVNLNEKRDHERIKNVVKENLQRYILLLRNLIDKLDCCFDLKLENKVEKINVLFSDFKKQAHMNYQKATILIGKEMEEIRDNTSNFFKDMRNEIDNNKEFVDRYKIIESVKKRFDLIEENNKKKEECDNRVISIDKDIKILERINAEISIKITKVKESENYRLFMKREQEYSEKKINLKIITDNTSKLIDFKDLARIYHSNEKIMNLVKDYRANFGDAMERDNENKFFDLIGESNLNYVEIKKGIEEIRKLKKEIESFIFGEDESLALKKNINENEETIKRLNKDKEFSQNKAKQFEEKSSEEIVHLTNELKKLDIELKTDSTLNDNIKHF
jgi:hypothetical protein